MGNPRLVEEAGMMVLVGAGRVLGPIKLGRPAIDRITDSNSAHNITRSGILGCDCVSGVERS